MRNEAAATGLQGRTGGTEDEIAGDNGESKIREWQQLWRLSSSTVRNCITRDTARRTYAVGTSHQFCPNGHPKDRSEGRTTGSPDTILSVGLLKQQSRVRRRKRERAGVTIRLMVPCWEQRRLRSV